MRIPYDKIKDIQDQLPSVNDFEGYSIDRDVTHEGNTYRVIFYKAKASEYTPYFWICNPFNLTPYVNTSTEKQQ